MKCLVILFVSCVCCIGQNFVVRLAKDDPQEEKTMPPNWPVEVIPIGAATELPIKFKPPWQFMTGDQLSKLFADNEAAKAAWNKAQEDAPRIAAEQEKAAAEQAKAAEKVRIDSVVTEVEVGLKEWQFADEKAKGDVLLKLLHVIIDALRSLGADVKSVDKPSETKP